ncbi:MAG: AAA family ATPase [Planctomycetia bacterium]|nr:AAA family ATPase [Planctomycetia bacterium]
MFYTRHWGLSRAPFASDADPAQFHANPMHDEALARLQFLVDGRRRLGLLAGEPGTGKSLLLAVLAAKLAAAGKPVVRVNLTAVEPAEFPGLIAAGLRLNPRDNETPAKVWRMIADRITEHRYQQVGTVILIDDVDQAPPEVQSMILRLAQIDAGAGAWLTVIVATHPREVSRMNPQLLDLVELSVGLEPWDPSTAAEFLATALKKAGSPSKCFDALATERLHQLSGGIPRRVSQLADLALLAAAGDDRPLVDAATVEAVFSELSVNGFASITT